MNSNTKYFLGTLLSLIYKISLNLKEGNIPFRFLSINSVFERKDVCDILIQRSNIQDILETEKGKQENRLIKYSGENGPE